MSAKKEVTETPSGLPLSGGQEGPQHGLVEREKPFIQPEEGYWKASLEYTRVEHVKRNSFMMVRAPSGASFRLGVVLRIDACPPAVIRTQAADGRYTRKLDHKKFVPWGEDATAKITAFCEKELGLRKFVHYEATGIHILEFTSGIFFRGVLGFGVDHLAADAFDRLEGFVKENIDILTTDNDTDLEWVPDYFFTCSRRILEMVFGIPFKSLLPLEGKRSLTMTRREFLKYVLAGIVGTSAAAKVFAQSGAGQNQEIIGTPEIRSEVTYRIQIDGEKLPYRPYELIKWTSLWYNYYEQEFALRVYSYWQTQGYDLPTAARLAAEDLEKMLNKVGCGQEKTWQGVSAGIPPGADLWRHLRDVGDNYWVGWRIADQILQTQDNGDGTASVRVRPLIYDMMYWSTPYPVNHFLVREGIVTSFPTAPVVWVLGGQNGYMVSATAPPATCSNPFGGNCETGCLVGCESQCEGDPCQFSCQAGCQTACETNCQVCANNMFFCGYTLTVTCRDNGDGTVTVTGGAYYDDPGGGQSPMANQEVTLYHASWGGSYTATTGADGTYSAVRPKPPAGSTPIYASWTDPTGTDHQASTSACFGCPPGKLDCAGVCQECCTDADCPPGQVCQNGTCVSTGGSGGGAQIDNLIWNTDTLCDTGFSVTGRLTENGAGVSGTIEVYFNGTRILGPISTNWDGTFDTGLIDKALYQAHINTDRNNEIRLRGVTATGSVTSVTKTEPPCCGSYSISCQVDKSTVCLGELVTFSGKLSNPDSGCPVEIQDVDVYWNGAKVAVVTTDLGGYFSYSTTLPTEMTHSFEARYGDARCSASVTACPAQVEVLVKKTLASHHNTYMWTGEVWISPRCGLCSPPAVELAASTTTADDIRDGLPPAMKNQIRDFLEADNRFRNDYGTIDQILSVADELWKIPLDTTSKTVDVNCNDCPP
jgi:hypothetical protein